MARPEKLSKSRPPLQVQTASAQNVLHRPQFRHPFPPSQPVSACSPGWACSSSNTTTTTNNNNNSSSSSSLSLYATPPTPAIPGPYNRDRNWSVSSAPLPPPAPMPRPRTMVRRTSCPDLSRVISQTVEILANEAVWERECGSYAYGEGVHGSLSRKLDQIITLIDEGLFNRERDLAFASPVYDDDYYQAVPGFGKSKHMQNAAEYFSRVYLYYNSRLPAQLPPLKLSIYTPTYTLLQLAARYSRQVYQKPVGPERQCYIDADWRQGTKAMVIKSIPLDHRNAIVFAIRGTQSFRDWTINLKTDPKPPEGFLDDPDNLCHAGFLSVARKMVGLVAARLRSLLAEDPNRVAHSLIITGHSAGGAVASLLFCHMLSEYVQSELTHLRPFFKRVHCVTFGSPPVSIRPLQLPRWNARSPKRSMFFAFINEGDPVPRAEKAYLRSLLDLYVSPTKAQGESRNWKVPRATLSAAGRLVLLRRKQPVVYPSLHGSEGVEASIITHGQLREVVFGDPLMHTMDLYTKRIEELARNAVHYSAYSP